MCRSGAQLWLTIYTFSVKLFSVKIIDYCELWAFNSIMQYFSFLYLIQVSCIKTNKYSQCNILHFSWWTFYGMRFQRVAPTTASLNMMFFRRHFLSGDDYNVSIGHTWNDLESYSINYLWLQLHLYILYDLYMTWCHWCLKCQRELLLY